MSEQTINQITPQQGATNETLIADLTSYFRYNEESREYEINARIDHAVSTDNWVPCPSSVRDRFANPASQPTVGQIVWALNNAQMRERRIAADRDKFQMDAYRAIEIIGERLIKEAEDRGWCDDFDRIISDVNEMLPGSFALPEREKEYEVSWKETILVTLDRSVTVRARNEDEARDEARSEAESIDVNEIIGAVRYGGWEVDEYADVDYEVSEV